MMETGKSIGMITFVSLYISTYHHTAYSKQIVCYITLFSDPDSDISPSTESRPSKSPTRIAPTTTRKTTTPTPTPCQDRTMTLYVASRDQKAFVHLTADRSTELSVGSHVIQTNGCILQVNVIGL